MLTTSSSAPLQREGVNAKNKIKRSFDMPYVSQRQQGFAHTPAGKKAMGADTVKEFDEATKGAHGLPKVAPGRESIGKRIMDMVHKKKAGR